MKSAAIRKLETKMEELEQLNTQLEKCRPEACRAAKMRCPAWKRAEPGLCWDGKTPKMAELKKRIEELEENKRYGSSSFVNCYH